MLFIIALYNFLAARIATIFPPAEPLYNNEYWLVGIETHNQIDRVNNYKHKSRIHFNGEKYNVVKNANWFLLQTITKSWISAISVFTDAPISFKAKTVTLCYILAKSGRLSVSERIVQAVNITTNGRWLSTPGSRWAPGRTIRRSNKRTITMESDVLEIVVAVVD